MRHSPLTQITPANVGQLGRVYTIDLHSLDPDIRRGEQSYPLALDGTLYVTTNDGQVFALNGATGKVIWHFKPDEQRALQELRHRREPRPRLLRRHALPAHARHAPDKLDPATGALGRRVAIGARRPGRRLELRLLGDERADLRQPPRDRRRRRLRIRRARLRDGVDDRPHARLAEPGLDHPAGAAELALASAASSAAAPSGRPSPSTRRPTRSSSGRARRRRSTSRSSGPGRTRAPTR